MAGHVPSLGSPPGRNRCQVCYPILSPESFTDSSRPLLLAPPIGAKLGWQSVPTRPHHGLKRASPDPCSKVRVLPSAVGMLVLVGPKVSQLAWASAVDSFIFIHLFAILGFPIVMIGVHIPLTLSHTIHVAAPSALTVCGIILFFFSLQVGKVGGVLW